MFAVNIGRVMKLETCISSSLVRHFPQSPVGGKKRLAIDAALNERFSFQVVVRQESGDPITVKKTARDRSVKQNSSDFFWKNVVLTAST